VLFALDNLPKDWPPMVDEFRALCAGLVSQAGLSHNTAAYRLFDKSKAIEKKPDIEIAKSALSDIRQTLRG
jgi:hypothetical protein